MGVYVYANQESEGLLDVKDQSLLFFLDPKVNYDGKTNLSKRWILFLINLLLLVFVVMKSLHQLRRFATLHTQRQTSGFVWNQRNQSKPKQWCISITAVNAITKQAKNTSQMESNSNNNNPAMGMSEYNKQAVNKTYQ